MELEEDAFVLINTANKDLQHRDVVADAFRRRAGQRFQAKSDKIIEHRKTPIKRGEVVLQKTGRPNGKPVIHTIGHIKGQNGDIAEEFTAILTLDTLD